MKIEINQTTLIDQVEDSLLTYFKKNDLRINFLNSIDFTVNLGSLFFFEKKKLQKSYKNT